ncbi:MAG: methyltransferase domain-containing protein [Lachnospiraceae bacterium]|nr:methyltransferase domain-containing protein [Lachnospiraceae bacterium]
MNNIENKRIENYRDFFTKEYLMGPNSLRLLDEMLRKYPLEEGGRVMDLGCGMGITSLFLAKEAKANVFATDLWISATDNARSFEKWGVADRIIPIHADANNLPYAHEYFDAIVSIDAYHYFGAKRGVFEEKVLPFLKKDGVMVVAMPGLKEELNEEQEEALLEWFEGSKDDLNTFHSRKWWLDLFKDNDRYEVVKDFDLDCFNEAWQDWFESGHEYGIKDRRYFDKGLGEYLSFIGFVIKRIF